MSQREKKTIEPEGEEANTKRAGKLRARIYEGKSRKGAANPQQIERAAKIISEARDPILLAGNGVARGRASEALRHFAETLGIPVVETFMGNPAVRAGTRFVSLIFEDSGYGVIKWNQLKRYGRPAFVNFGNPDFVALAESFGCRGYKVTAAQELVPILEEAFRQRVPAVVACPVDYGENLRLTEKLGAWVCPI